MIQETAAARALAKMQRMKAHIARNEAAAGLPDSQTSTHFSKDEIEAVIVAVTAFQPGEIDGYIQP